MAIYSFDGKTPQIGKETYVSELAMVIGDVRIGDNCYIGHGVILRGDYGTIEIGNGTDIEEGAIVHAPPRGTCQIGEWVTVGHGAIVHSKAIGNLAVIGMGAVISISSEIGERSFVGEGAVVQLKKKIPGGVVVAGNPARIVREISAKDTKLSDWAKQLYIDLVKKYLDIGIHKLD